jgi:DNA-binding SARP family transcriptional activator
MTSPVRLLRSLPGAVGRLIVAAALLGGLPYVLAHLVGWPLPRHLAWRGLQQFLVSPLSDDAIIKGLACVAWLLWAVFVLSVLIEVAAAVRGRSAPRLPVIAPVQAIAAALVGTTVLTTFPGPSAGPHVSGLQHALAAHVVATAPPRPGQPDPVASLTAPAGTAVALDARTTSGTAHESAASRPRVYRVAEGDDLWEIAARFLGDGEQWHEIYDLNAGKPQSDGRALTDPDLIYPGWVLLLPAAPGQAASAAPGAHPRHGHPQGHRRAAPPSPSPSPSPRTSRPVPSPVPSAHGHPGTHKHPSSTVILPSGAIIGLSLATAAGLALVLTRLHRRRRREPAPAPGTAPAEPELTPALRSIRQAHLAASQQPPDEDTDPGHYPPAPSETPADDNIPPRRGPSTETINVAVRDNGEEVALDLACVPGTGLTGPGAADVIRAIAITLLARRTQDQAEVFLCGDDARHLLVSGDQPGLAQVPGLSAFSATEDALSRLEAEIIHRRRLFDAASSDDLAAYRDANPDEPLPTILAIALADSPHAGRLAGVLNLGQRLGITGILAGPWPAGATCQITGNGIVTSTSTPELRHLDGTQMYQLTADETAEILSTLAGASGTEPAGTEPGPARFLPAPPAEPPGPAEEDHAAHLAILGPFQLYACGEPVTKGLRRKAAELLTYLAVHRDGATTDAILDALWQDTPAARATPILHAATTNIRKILRDITGATEAAFIIRAGDQLRIDPRLVSTDLWQFQDALASAAHAADDHDRHASLQAAADLWHGDIGTGIDSVWIDEHRETLRRDAVDTLARLAELSEPDDPEQALGYLERAITIDRYQEPLYRRIMRLQGNLSRPDAARRTYQLLESRLTEIEAEPDELTARLLHEILHVGSGDR